MHIKNLVRKENILLMGESVLTSRLRVLSNGAFSGVISYEEAIIEMDKLLAGCDGDEGSKSLIVRYRGPLEEKSVNEYRLNTRRMNLEGARRYYEERIKRKRGRLQNLADTIADLSELLGSNMVLLDTEADAFLKGELRRLEGIFERTSR